MRSIIHRNFGEPVDVLGKRPLNPTFSNSLIPR